jgi:ABC-type metal ion transport system substrate-binding protein
VTYAGVRDTDALFVILIAAVVAACGLGAVVVFLIDCCCGKGPEPVPKTPTEQSYSEVLNSAPKDDEEPHTSPLNLSRISDRDSPNKALNESQISHGLNESRISETSTVSKRV